MTNTQRINDYPVVTDITDENAQVLALVDGELVLVPPSDFAGPVGPDWNPASAPEADTFGDEFDYVVIVQGGVARRIPASDVTITPASEAEALAAVDDTKAMTPALAAVRDEKYDVRRSGAVLNGIDDDTAAMTDALTVVAGGGSLSVPGGRAARVSDTLPIVRTALQDPLILELNKSPIMWDGGAQPVFTFAGGGSHATQVGPEMRDVLVDGGGVATAGFYYSDSGDARFLDVDVRNVAGPAFWLRNVDAFSENMTFRDIRVQSCEHIARYDGAVETGGAGSASFARQHWDTVQGTTLSVSWFHISTGASLYDSELRHIKGNLGNLAVPVFDIFGGTGTACRIRGLDVEQGAAGSYLFDFNSSGGNGPTVDDYILRDATQLVTGGTVANFGTLRPLANTLTMMDGAGVALAGTAAISGGGKDMIAFESTALTAGVAKALTCARANGALIVLAYGGGNLPAMVWSATKRASGTAVADVVAMSTSNGTGGETLALAWNTSGSQPRLTASADMTVTVVVLKAG